ncbi:MAG: T9SS type A sorting domain-containing protein [Ignavibacteria bacterium]|nr:T9SS type A sorting domain-containing protein [Ignavibacteria bacterium]
MKKIYLVFTVLMIINFASIFSNNIYAQKWTLAGQIQSPGLEPSISVIDEYNVWIAGGTPDTPRVYKTTNGGMNWIELPTTGISKELYCIWAVNPTTVYVGEGILSGNAKLFKTTNGGDNWTVALTTNPNQGYFNSIVFSNSDPLVGAVQSLRIHITTNGGVTWIQKNPGGSVMSSVQNSLVMIDANFLGFGMNNGASRITLTLNSGTSWIVQNLNLTGSIVCGLDFKDDKLIGLASTTTSLPYIARTSNGGDLWTPIDIGSDISGSTIIDFIQGTNVAYIVGSNGTIKKSSDDGQTWSTFSTSGVSGITHFSAKNINNVVYGYAVSNAGSVVKFTDSLTVITGLKLTGSETVTDYKLYQNYPNPFNPVTNVKWQILNSGKVEINVYDVLGKKVAQLVNENLKAGMYEIKFDGSKLNSGVYFYRIITDGFSETKRMILIK